MQGVNQNHCILSRSETPWFPLLSDWNTSFWAGELYQFSCLLCCKIERHSDVCTCIQLQDATLSNIHSIHATANREF